MPITIRHVRRQPPTKRHHSPQKEWETALQLCRVSSGKSIVDCATLAVEDMTRLEAQVKAKGARFLEAPVSGSKGPAAQGQHPRSDKAVNRLTD